MYWNHIDVFPELGNDGRLEFNVYNSDGREAIRQNVSQFGHIALLVMNVDESLRAHL